MIDRVDNNTYTNPYSRSSKRVSPSNEEVPKFLLDGDEEGVVWDHNPKKDTPSRNVQPNVQPKQDTYVSTIPKADNKVSEEVKKEEGPSFISLALNRVKDFFTGIFRFIWYGNEDEGAKNEVSGEDSLKEDNFKADTAKEESAKQELKSDVLPDITKPKLEFDERLEEARHGVNGIPARSTSLLTTYDRHGLIRNLSKSDEGRILRDDKSIKL